MSRHAAQQINPNLESRQRFLAMLLKFVGHKPKANDLFVFCDNKLEILVGRVTLCQIG